MALLDRRMNPSAGELRWFGVLILAFSLVVGTLIRWQADAPRVAIGIVGVGATLCVVFYALRPLRLPIYRLWMRAFHPIGWLISHIVLVSIYYLVITPIGWAMRLVGYDPLTRRFDPSAASYWVRHDPSDRAERYFRQY